MEFDNEIDYLFMFCKNCWDYRKFVFEVPLNFEQTNKTQVGKCVVCENLQMISSPEIKEYYDHLNDHNQ